MKKLITTLLVTSASISSGFTLSGGLVPFLGDDAGVALTSDTEFAIVVALDTATNPFSGLLANDNISTGSTIGGGDYFVLDTGTAVDGALGVAAQLNITNFQTSGTSIAADVAAGNEVGFLWFPSLSTSDDVLDQGDSYGFFTASDWLLPVQGASESFTNRQELTPLIASEVVLIPEPSSTALLGLGGLALLARRRRA